MKEEGNSKKEESEGVNSLSISQSSSSSPSLERKSVKQSKDKRKDEKSTAENENVKEVTTIFNGTPAKPKKPRAKIWGRSKKDDNDLSQWNLTPDEIEEIKNSNSGSSKNPKKLKHRSSFEKREKKIHTDIEEKEKELDETYQEIKRLIDSLVNSIHDSQPKEEVVDISNAIGVLVAKTGDIKRDLCEMYEKEQDLLSIPISDNEDEDDADSIDAESFAFYELNHIRIHSTKSDQVGEHSTSHSHTHEHHSNNTSGILSTSNKNIKKEGFLSKKNGLRNKWSLRLFVLENHELKWYDKESLLKSPRKPKGRFDLWKSSILLKLDDQSNESSTRFYVQSSGKTINLQAKTEEEKKLWIDSILESIESAIAVHGCSSPSQQPKHSSNKS